MWENLRWWIVDYFWGGLKHDMKYAIDDIKPYSCPVCGKPYWLGRNSVNCCKGTKAYEDMRARARQRLKELDEEKNRDDIVPASYLRYQQGGSTTCTLCNGTGQRNGVICGRCDGTGKFPPSTPPAKRSL